VSFVEIMHAYAADLVPEEAPSGWGWPLVRPSGLASRVLKALSVLHATVPMMLALPEAVHPLDTEERVDALRTLLESYAHHLDPDLGFQAIEAATAPCLQRTGAARQTLPHQDGPSEGVAAPRGVAPESPVDEDGTCCRVAADSAPPETVGKAGGAPRDCFPHDSAIARGERFTPETMTADLDTHPGCSREAESAATVPGQSASQAFSRIEVESAEDDAIRGALEHLSDADDDMVARAADMPQLADAQPLTEGAALCEPFFEVARKYRRPASVASLRAVHAALSGSLLSGLPPGRAAGGPHRYDARARCACMLLAHWLRVPRAAFAALEATAAAGTEADVVIAASAKQLHSYHDKAATAWKVGATAAAGGVLMAATAGLAAPVLLGVLGAASTTTVTAAAAASGYAGSTLFSSKMAKRVADVSEFGFVSLTEWDAAEVTSERSARGATADAVPPKAAATVAQTLNSWRPSQRIKKWYSEKKEREQALAVGVSPVASRQSFSPAGAASCSLGTLSTR
jgi:hypothetical protein